MKERNPLNKQEGVAYEIPVTIEILSSAENTYLLHNDLKDILVDTSGCCEYMGYVDQDRDMRVKIECIVSEEEKQGLGSTAHKTCDGFELACQISGQ